MKKYVISFVLMFQLLLLSLGVGIFSFVGADGLSSTTSNGQVTVSTVELENEAQLSLKELQEATDEQLQSWAKLEKFDSREYGLVTAVDNQERLNLCWAYATIAAAESSILREGLDPDLTCQNLNFSEENAAWTMFNRLEGVDPLGNTSKDTYTGNYNVGSTVREFLSSLHQGLALVNESEFANPSKPEEYGTPKFKLENAYNVDPNNVMAIKEQIVKHGAVTVAYTVGSNLHTYYNDNGSHSGGHISAIVGWDDSIPAEKFEQFDKVASQNGAFIIKNSWGEYNSKDQVAGAGYFYMSYDMATTGKIDQVWALDFMLASEYDNTYYYDGITAHIPRKYEKHAVIFETKGANLENEETLDAVAFWATGEELDCTIDIYTNLFGVDFGNINVHDGLNNPERGIHALSIHRTLKGSNKNEAYFTVPLDTKITLDPGSSYSIVISLKGGDLDYTNGETSTNDLTFSYKSSAEGWISAKLISTEAYPQGKVVARIKGLTNVSKRATQLESKLEYARVEVINPKTDFNDFNPIYPEVNVYFGMEKVDANKYDVFYRNNNIPGTAWITVSGKNGAVGTKDQSFYIFGPDNPPNLPCKDIYVSKSCRYVRDVILPDGWEWLKSQLNEEITQTDVFTAQYTAGDAYCYRNLYYDVYIHYIDDGTEVQSIDNAVVSIEGNTYDYTGYFIRPKVTVTLNGRTLREGIDYFAYYQNNVNGGEATITVKGINFYNGEKSTRFTIVGEEKPFEKTDISEAQIEISGDFTYNGSQIIPTVKVTYNGITLRLGVDYTLKYENNIYAGQAWVVITAMGEDYTGSVKKCFFIIKAERSEFEVSQSGWTYGEEATRPQVTGTEEESVITYMYSTSQYTGYAADKPINAGKYWVKAEIQESLNYRSAIAYAHFEIAQALKPNNIPQKINVPADARYYHDIILPTGWSWSDADEIIDREKNSAAIVFEDSTNYQNTAFEVELVFDAAQAIEGSENNARILWWVLGIVGGITVIGVAGWLILRRKKKQREGKGGRHEQ